jgi:hypothetical protein
VSKYVQWEGACVTKLARDEGEKLADRRLKDDYERVLRQACPMDKRILSKTMDTKEAEDVAALKKTFAPFVSSDQPTKVYKAALEHGLGILREGLGRARKPPLGIIVEGVKAAAAADAFCAAAGRRCAAAASSAAAALRERRGGSVDGGLEGKGR